MEECDEADGWMEECDEADGWKEEEMKGVANELRFSMT